MRKQEDGGRFGRLKDDDGNLHILCLGGTIPDKIYCCRSEEYAILIKIFNLNSFGRNMSIPLGNQIIAQEHR
jgi:hypothetical protein